MLRQIAEGVLVHESSFLQSNAVVVQGTDGVLLIDPGVLDEELASIANDLRELGQPVVAGFATHPHWDHLLWHAEFGTPPRYGTATGAETVRVRIPDAAAKARVAQHLIPPDIVDNVPLDLLGEITGLPAGATRLSWDGPAIRIIEHEAHAPGHAALLIEEDRVLVAGDMLSDAWSRSSTGAAPTRSGTTSRHSTCSRAWPRTSISSSRAMDRSAAPASCKRGSSSIAPTYWLSAMVVARTTHGSPQRPSMAPGCPRSTNDKSGSWPQ
jgi:hypothetical protein